MVLALVVFAILVATLTPTGVNRHPFSFALEFGGRGLADAIVNVWLFVPFGLAVSWRRPVVVAAVSGLLLTTSVELAQMLIPGRDPALSDIIFNTLGAVGGGLLAQRRRWWLTPNTRQAKALTVAAVLFAASVMSVTTYLLGPRDGVPLGASREVRLPPSHGNPEYISTLLMLDLSAEEPVVVARAGDDLLLRYPSRATEVGLEEPEYWSKDVFEECGSGMLELVTLSRSRARWQIDMGCAKATLGPTVGRGWSVFSYPSTIARRWGSVVDFLWVLALCLPVGFWARGRTLAITSGGVLVLILIAIPIAVGGRELGSVGWIAAAMGVATGKALSRFFPRIPT